MFLVPMTRSSSALARSLDRLFDDAFDRVYGGGAEAASRSPALDVAETETGYAVSVDLPGVSKGDVKITIDGRSVSVNAQTQRDDTKQAADGQPRVIYRERSASRFARSFTLPEEIDQDASQAKLDNGVLTLTLAKKRAAASKQLTIN